MNPLSTATPPEPLDPQSSRKKIWRVGTLTYTTAGLAILFGWLLWGDLAYQLRERAFPPTLQLMLDHFKAKSTTKGLLTVSLPALLIIILSPIISYVSDRHRGRWGRRIPYLLIITPISVLAMVGMAFAPHMTHSDDGIIAYLAAFSICFTACDTICNLIFIALCNDVVPREIVGQFFGLFRVISLGAGIYFNHYLLKTAQQHSMAIFLVMAAIYGFGFTTMCLRVREGEYPPPEANAQNPWRATVRYIRDCCGHSFYRWIFLSTALAYMAFIPINGFVLYYATSINMDMGYYGNAASLQLLLSLIQAYPLGWLADKIHPLRLTVISLIMYTVATFISFKFIHGPDGIARALVVVGVCSGWYLTANGPLFMRLFPKIEFAQFCAAANIAAYTGTLLVGYLCGILLEANHKDYRYIYLWASVLGLLSLLATIVVYKKFLRLGGTRDYVAPGFS
ncbi:MAG TPA: MFS transporter [Tepidisphaeraceae bacterium]|jgi:MFS family permease